MKLTSTAIPIPQSFEPSKTPATAFAPSNIALIKYWGKRDTTYNLPMTDSLSISLGDLGTTTTCACDYDANAADTVSLNGQTMVTTSAFYQRLTHFLDHFRLDPNWRFNITTHSNIPTAAGLASSASGFAALVKALDMLFNWKLTPQQLSILARLGSGSACRSIYTGFVHWQAGSAADGSDSFAYPLNIHWPEFNIGIVMVDDQPKTLSSRDAMNTTVATSPLYATWPQQVQTNLSQMLSALSEKNFAAVGRIAEHNAVSMHATMLAATPAINFSSPASIAIQNQVRALRKEGLPVYFTQDAGPNIKLLFLEKDRADVCAAFTDIIIPNRS